MRVLGLKVRRQGRKDQWPLAILAALLVIAGCGPDATPGYTVEIDNHSDQEVIVVPSGVGVMRETGSGELGEDAAYIVAAGATTQVTPGILVTSTWTNGVQTANRRPVLVLRGDCSVLVEFEAGSGRYHVTIAGSDDASVSGPDMSPHPDGPYLPVSPNPCN